MAIIIWTWDFFFFFWSLLVFLFLVETSRNSLSLFRGVAIAFQLLSRWLNGHRINTSILDVTNNAGLHLSTMCMLGRFYFLSVLSCKPFIVRSSIFSVSSSAIVNLSAFFLYAVRWDFVFPLVVFLSISFNFPFVWRSIYHPWLEVFILVSSTVAYTYTITYEGENRYGIEEP